MHIVSLSAVTWGFHLVGRTRWMTQCWHQQGVPTIFVETANAGRRYRLKRRLGGLFSEKPPVPLLLPDRPAKVLDWPRMPQAGLEARIRDAAAGLRRDLERYCRLEESVAVVVTPAWLPWLAELPFAKIVYDCIDEAIVHSPTPAHHEMYGRWEAALIDRADAAVVTVNALGRYLKSRRSDLPIALIRNGVDAAWFRERAADASRPNDLPAIGRPIVGFVGALYDWVDWELIADVARSLPELAFVFVGPIGDEAGAALLRGFDNITMLGRKPYGEVPAYMQAFDVCWVPFKQNRVAEAADPVKLYEYLSLGKPVVTTPVGDVVDFGDVVSIGRATDEIAAQLQKAIAAGDARRDERLAFADRSTWSARAEEYASYLQGILAG